MFCFFFFFQAEDGIRDVAVTGVQTCALPILTAYYRHAIALIVPSVCFETFGIILIEAFQQATPVIARRIGPFPEIVSQCGGGELFSSPEELVAAMSRLQTQAGLRDRLGRAAYAGFLRNWSESAVVPRYLDLIRRIAEAKGHTA